MQTSADRPTYTSVGVKFGLRFAPGSNVLDGNTTIMYTFLQESPLGSGNYVALEEHRAVDVRSGIVIAITMPTPKQSVTLRYVVQASNGLGT